MTDTERVDALSARVEKLERYIWVAVVTLAIFGVSGAYGARWISKVSGQLDGFDKEVDVLYDGARASADQWLEDAKRELVREARAQRAWIPFKEPMEIGSLPIGSTQLSAFELPPAVPKSAREILIYVKIYTGDTKSSSSPADFWLYTQDGEAKYLQVLYWYRYPQEAVPFNSDNLWFPLTPEHKLYVQLKGGAPLPPNTGGKIAVLGYRE